MSIRKGVLAKMIRAEIWKPGNRNKKVLKKFSMARMYDLAHKVCMTRNAIKETKRYKFLKGLDKQRILKKYI